MTIDARRVMLSKIPEVTLTFWIIKSAASWCCRSGRGAIPAMTR